MWGVTELRVNAKPHSKTEDLIEKIKEVMGSLDRDTVAKACRGFWSRIEPLRAISSNSLILNTFICYYFFTSIKSVNFQLCYIIFNITVKNSGNIAATL